MRREETLTLAGTIRSAEAMATDHTKCRRTRENNRQLADWLKELQAFRHSPMASIFGCAWHDAAADPPKYPHDPKGYLCKCIQLCAGRFLKNAVYTVSPYRGNTNGNLPEWMCETMGELIVMEWTEIPPDNRKMKEMEVLWNGR